jgi:hypothetical protein
MRAQGLNVERPEIGERLGAPGRRALGATSRTSVAFTVDCERVLTVVLLLQLVASAVMVGVMGLRSPGNAHPDELLHFRAGQYFREHWLPPPVGAPEAATTYSWYGMSYLDQGDIVYWALGKATALGKRLGLAPAAAMRWFQLSLYWGLVVWMIFRARTFTPALGFLLLTPQVWYVFSYINGDALPFALLTVVLVELGWPDSSVRSFLSGTQARPGVGVLVIAAAIGLLAVSKLNYLVSIVFVGWAFLWLRGETRWRRAALIALVAAAIALPWATYHSWVNDFHTGQKIVEYAEKAAVPDLKPSAQASSMTFPLVALRAKGVPLWAILVKSDWVGLSFRSFCGFYGWMSIEGPPWLYQIFGGLYAGLLAILILPAVLRGSPRVWLLVTGVVVCATLVLGQSVYRSWVFDFQGQGRYLFPILPMLFFYWRQCEATALRLPALVVVALLGGLGLLSFALIGLGALA